jgi:adenylylsulfate kinase
MYQKILIMGLPGAGKTTLALALSRRLKAVVFNADGVRAHINKDLGFSLEDRIEHARRMGWLCDRVIEAGGVSIADFVCPTPQTRRAFGEAFVVWVDRIKESRFADTNRLFVPPEKFQVRVTPEDAAEIWAARIVSILETRRHPGPIAQERPPLMVSR